MIDFISKMVSNRILSKISVYEVMEFNYILELITFTDTMSRFKSSNG